MTLKRIRRVGEDENKRVGDLIEDAATNDCENEAHI